MTGSPLPASVSVIGTDQHFINPFCAHVPIYFNVLFECWGSSIYIFQKLKFCMCAYQGVRNVSFLENFGYILNEWLPGKHSNKREYYCKIGHVQEANGTLLYRYKLDKTKLSRRAKRKKSRQWKLNKKAFNLWQWLEKVILRQTVTGSNLKIPWEKVEVTLKITKSSPYVVEKSISYLLEIVVYSHKEFQTPFRGRKWTNVPYSNWKWNRALLKECLAKK